MRFTRLHVQGLRCLADVAVPLHEGLHVFVGDNGAGKTSLLEAAYLLSHGRSFRSGAREALLQRGRPAMSVFAELVDGAGRRHKAGLGRSGGRWEARLDGDTVNLSELVQACAVVCFEPGSHELIAGPADERRRFLDWGVFHVEHAFLPAWRRYQRALRQRNVLLRGGRSVSEGLFVPWELELASAAQAVDEARARYLEQWRPHLARVLDRLLPELGGAHLRYRRGWNDAADLLEVLAQMREADQVRGFTAAGPHRADWSLAFDLAPGRDYLSRGQEKLTALACLLAQAGLHAEAHGDWPVICLDDLASELDEAHQALVVAQLASVEAQVLVTGTGVPAALQGLPHRLFHVEQGQVTPLV